MIPRTMTTMLEVQNMLIEIIQMIMTASDSTDDDHGT